MDPEVIIIGAGLAGVEAAWQLADAGVRVKLFEMKPRKFTPAHRLDGFAELVCSNSLRSNDPSNAAGLLKEEMRALNSLVIRAAYGTAVPAGKALAVDRKLFSEYVTREISGHPLVEVVNKEVISFSDRYTIIATGPLTSDPLSREIAGLTGEEHLYFYDSVAPIVDASSIDFSKGFRSSRYGYGGDDYWNFPLAETEYNNFLLDLAGAEKVVIRAFEDPQYFEGCLPIEVMAERGPGTLRHGPMKPFGLKDPSTGREAYAIVQLRQEDGGRTMYNMVGFQTRLTRPEQKRIFRSLPGFAGAEFLRFGVIHRNTYINSPKVLNDRLEMKERPGLFFAGQITGVEGYIESAATGLWTGLYIVNRLRNREIKPPPPTTAIGSLLWHVTNPNHRNFQPMNVNFGLMPIIRENLPKNKRNAAMVDRARSAFAGWREALF